MVPGLSRSCCYLFALGLSLAGHGLLLQLPAPRFHPATEQPLAAEATNSTVTDIAIVSLPSPPEQPSEPDQPPSAAQGTSTSQHPELQHPEQLDPLPVHSPTPPDGHYLNRDMNRENSPSPLEKPTAAAAVMPSPPAESVPTDDNSAKPTQFYQFWDGLSDRTLDAGSLAETLELFGTPYQAALFVDEQGKARSHLETFVLLPRHSPTQALAQLIQPQLIDTAACDVNALSTSPHQQAGGGAVYATQCGPLRQYLNLVPISGGTLIVLWREEP
ncbi:hypothetical protein [Nodosilinea sp. P-1105]|uniref:hypothetical protein n=1 Tax=Nodosilinea sp. P-1105 TaxID=2546229 RepID=UPI00146AB311|nr:hypothetical protein [Nodosilinea sp. P-1105]NMF84225.1 hypothetical protein [Nodosilinea sp. P-1105]